MRRTTSIRSGSSRQPRGMRWAGALLAVLVTALGGSLALAEAGPTPVRAVTDTRLGWPLRPDPVVVRPFEEPPGPYGPGHRGADLRAEPGQQVLSSGDGVVVFAGPLAGRGVISIEHEGGLRTSYEPVAPAVSGGEQVARGQVLGTAVGGHPGCAALACLHWGLRQGETYLDPLDLLRTGTHIRLKPWRRE